MGNKMLITWKDYFIKSIVYLSLLKFNKNASAIFWVKEYNGLVVCTDARYFTQATNSFLPNFLHGTVDVINFNADVMKTTSFVFIQKPLPKYNGNV